MDIGEFIRTRPVATAFSVGALVICVVSGGIFLSMRQTEPLFAGPGVTKQYTLGEVPTAGALKGTADDTPVYELAGAKAGGSITLLGGTHPQEIAGMLAAIIVIENAKVQQGRITVLPRANGSGFGWTEPMEAYLHDFTIDTPTGQRWFRVGMRVANPTDQWPDPDVYIHKPSGENMIGKESRNLNRNHPGRAVGWITAEASNAITQLAKTSSITFDMHEAQPEYPVINKLVAHENAIETAATTQADLAAQKISISLDKSPKNLHGLSHREFGDFTNTQSILAETANPAMGRFRGRLSLDLVVNGKDENYVAASKLGKTFVKFDENGWPLQVRVARHLAAFTEIILAYNDLNPDNQIIVDNIPSYKDVVAKGVGAFLMGPGGPATTPAAAAAPAAAPKS